MIKFGVNLTGFSMTDFAAKNGDRVAVGRTLGAGALGFYQNAMFVYDNLLDVLVLPLHQVAVATLSKLQGDVAELKKSWAKALATVAFYAMPAFGILAVTSRDVIVILLGPKWIPAGALLSILALRGIPHSVERTLGWLHVAAGRTDRWFRWGIGATAAQLAVLLVAIRFGMAGVVWAYVGFMYIVFIPALAYAGRPLGVRAADIVRVVGGQLVSALVAAGGAAIVSSYAAATAPLVRIAFAVGSYLVIYLVLVIGCFRVRAPLDVCRSLVQDIVPARFRSVAVEGSI